jgi:Inositol 1,3,4-trisphosphate 5/6-kinase pre-ATP-grasp domain/Inositol 1,3,4-trisphosphate 5/6-kinase ATP-grasp domain
MIQPEFDVIFHKLTEDIDRVDSVDKIGALNAYLASHPKTVIVDPLEAVRKVTSRARCCETLANIIKKLSLRCPFTQPKFVLVESERVDLNGHILDLIAAKGFGFPVICKPVEACGTPNSHRMVRHCIISFQKEHSYRIVFNLSSLTERALF